jgi:hypothetical protein
MTTQNRARADDNDALRDARRARLMEVLGDHYFWIPRILLRARVWEWLVPWPGLWPIRVLQNASTRRTSSGSGWLTADIVLYLYLFIVTGFEPEKAVSAYAADIAKALFSGAFLVGTVLSVSVAMPGQAILRLVLARDPDFAVNFVVPSLWAFLWGVFSGVLMTFFGGLEHVVPHKTAWGIWMQRLVLGAAIYAGSMVVNAILFTIRMYLLGLIQSAADSAAAEQVKSRRDDPC